VEITKLVGSPDLDRYSKSLFLISMFFPSLATPKLEGNREAKKKVGRRKKERIVKKFQSTCSFE
jgi:hypothetical protein